MNKKRLMGTVAAATVAFGSVCATGASLSYAKDQTVTLKFMYWGSVNEKQAIANMLKSFEATHPNIKVIPEYTTGDFATKINTLMASNELPDVSYLNEGLALKWAAQGKVLDMTPYLKDYLELANRLPQTYYYFAPGHTIGTNTAAEIATMFYNKDLFQQAKVSFPPADAAHAWTWKQFLDVAEKLTVDRNGKHPTDPGFDPQNIAQYGVSLPVTVSLGWYPFVISNGGSITNETGTKFTLNSPKSVEVFQALHDLIYKYHVAPTPTAQKSMPATSVLLETRKVAMVMDGQWALLDVAQSHMNFGMAVLPKFQKPTTMLLGAPTVVFSTTKHPKEAMELYLYHNNPNQVNLYKIGLWMPLEKRYYTDPKYIAAWTNNQAHPKEYRSAVIDYTLQDAVRSPIYSIKGFDQIDTVLEQGLSNIWMNKVTPKAELDKLATQIQPMLRGVYPSH